MFTFIYHILFFLFNVTDLIYLILYTFKTRLFYKKTLKKKSFFNLSVFEQLYLIFFYQESQYFFYYDKILVDSKMINCIRNSKYTSFANFLQNLHKLNITQNTSSLTEFIIFWRLINKFNLIFFWRILFMNYTLRGCSDFVLFYTLMSFFKKHFSADTYLITCLYKHKNFNFLIYKHILYNLWIQQNFKKNLLNKKKFFIYNSNFKQFNPAIFNPKKLNALNNFPSINNFFTRINFKLTDNFNYWRWSLKNIFFTEHFIINEDYKNIFRKKSPVRYTSSAITKYMTKFFLKNIKIFFLRKTKIFNKSRYSRNRQIYRTGVYWCLWLSIFLGWGLYFIFYRYTLTFSYLWWIVYLGLSSFIFNKTLKYRFYTLKFLFKEIRMIFVWCFLINIEFYNFLKHIYNYIISILNKSLLIFLFNAQILRKYILSFVFNIFISLVFLKLTKNTNISFKDLFFISIYPFSK